MRKLQSKEVKRKKERKKQLVIGIVMIGILVFSTAGFALFSGDDESVQENKKITHNGYEFIKQDNIWITQINNKNHAFFYLPTEIDNITINITNNILTYMNQPLYIVNSNAAENQITFNLYPEYILRIQNACLGTTFFSNVTNTTTMVNTTNCADNLPIKNCETNNIIIFQNENKTTNIYQEQNCIYIEGDSMKGTDKLIQKLLQIN